MRKLVSIQKVKNILPIENSDFLELAEIQGWRCVVNKNQFKVGELGIFFEIDSFLPIKEEYEFLRKSSYRNNQYIGEGFRIHTMKLRGVLSQGLLIPIPNDYNGSLEEGLDVTKEFGVVKWDYLEISGGKETYMGSKPFGIPTTDEDRIQSNPEPAEKMKGLPYYITTKMDGTSCSYYFKDNIFGVCNRSRELKDKETSVYWGVARKLEIEKKLRKLNKNITLQGELCGPTIRKNKMKLKEKDFYIFSIVDLDTGNYYEFKEFKKLSNELGLKTVPIEEEGEYFFYNQEQLIEKSKGKYECGTHKEGIVVRSQKNYFCGKFYSFKVINNDFLLKNKE